MALTTGVGRVPGAEADLPGKGCTGFGLESLRFH